MSFQNEAWTSHIPKIVDIVAWTYIFPKSCARFGVFSLPSAIVMPPDWGTQWLRPAESKESLDLRVCHACHACRTPNSRSLKQRIIGFAWLCCIHGVKYVFLFSIYIYIYTIQFARCLTGAKGATHVLMPTYCIATYSTCIFVWCVYMYAYNDNDVYVMVYNYLRYYW